MTNTPSTQDPSPAWTKGLTPKAAGTKLGLSSRTVRRLLAAGRIAGWNVSAGKQPRWIVDPSSLDGIVRPTSDN